VTQPLDADGVVLLRSIRLLLIIDLRIVNNLQIVRIIIHSLQLPVLVLDIAPLHQVDELIDIRDIPKDQIDVLIQVGSLSEVGHEVELLLLVSFFLLRGEDLLALLDFGNWLHLGTGTVSGSLAGIRVKTRLNPSDDLE